ncbi:ethanolamine ammonia lyase-activating protein [Chloroflexota bacterium]
MTIERIPDAGYSQKTAYESWMEAEGIPIVTGLSVDDLRVVPVEKWPRRGGLGAFINLMGNEQAAGSYICEIPPGGSLEPCKHLYEETILVLNGRGATSVWYEGGPKQTFEWGEWSLFAIPLNAWYQHFNGQGDKPARFFAVNSAPHMMNLFYNMDFIFNNDFIFKDRYAGQDDYFGGKGRLVAADMERGTRRPVWESNFVPDVLGFKLYDWKERGAGGTSILFEMGESSTRSHISEFPSGTYKKAHRHGPAANVVLLGGKGYSLMWLEGKPWVKCDWHMGSLLIPPNQWFHQHFNVGKEPARYLAISRAGGGRKHYMGPEPQSDVSVKEGGAQIEYEHENPEVRKLFQQELSKEGTDLKMPPALD